MSITKQEFGTINGEKVYKYILDNEKGLCAVILNYGGIVRNLFVTGRDGSVTDVVMGFETIEDCATRPGYYGAIIGRNSNRIENSKFTLNGREYNLAPNDGNHNIHGGIVGFDKKIWDVIEVCGEEGPSVVMSLTSHDGDEGFPGTIDVTVTYTVTNDNSLNIHYKAKCDEDTVCNFTNHSYFNLAGHASGPMTDQTLWLNSDFYTPINEKTIPTGEVLSVKETPFDFTTKKPIGQDIASNHGQIKLANGYDHNFVLNGTGYRLCAVAESTKTNIKMEMRTNQAGVQLYTTNSTDINENCKDNATYGKYQGFCLETQSFPDAVHQPHFPTIILKKGEEYEHITDYKFICAD